MRALKGSMVKVHFTGRLEDGTVFDTSEGSEPLHFTIGAGDMMPGFEAGITGMAVGETKTFTVSPEQAFGPRDEELCLRILKIEFPEQITPLAGQQFQIKHPSGNLITLTVLEVDDEGVTLDANHPLAGRELTFDVTIVQIG